MGLGMIVGAIVLAAGQSRRMGTAKLALPIAGEPMLRQTIAKAREAGLPILLVTGAHEQVVLNTAPDVPHVHAARHAEGLAESLKAGLAAAPAEWGAVLIMLGDMPLVSAATLRALANRLASGAEAVVPTYDGKRGNPAGFSRKCWPMLQELQGDSGARAILDRLGVVEIIVEDEGVLRDFDTVGDLAGL